MTFTLGMGTLSLVNLVVLSIPAYFLLIGVEWLVGRVRGRRIFRGPDVSTNLLLGSAQAVFGVVVAVIFAANYGFMYQHRFFEISTTSVWSWGILFVAQDFLYYWFHRTSHRVNIAWALHAPHHQSEDYNLSVALRQGPFQPAISHLFNLPLALCGFPPAMIVTVIGINTVYQFWIHTELIKRLGPLEWVFNTASHHRVHHGCNGRYLDKNHGGMLIVWDRLFGTFEPEGDQPVYGTVKPVASFNPAVCVVAPLQDLIQLAKSTPRWSDKIKLWFMPPEWRPQGQPPAELEVSPDRPKYEVRPSRTASVYATAMSLSALGVTFYFLYRGAAASGLTKLAFVVWFAASLAGIGAVMEGRAWAKWIEAARLLATPAVILLLMS